MSKQKETEIIPDESFKVLVRDAVEGIEFLDGVADELQVTPSTIYRWISGVSRPAQGIRRTIINTLEKAKVLHSVKYSLDIAKECLREAENWFNTAPATRPYFNTSKLSARYAVAEYIANQKGYTIYKLCARKKHELPM